MTTMIQEIWQYPPQMQVSHWICRFRRGSSMLYCIDDRAQFDTPVFACVNAVSTQLRGTIAMRST
eukprot:scaffold446203_cov38-Prasinocladus_malaysianus.AAC.1